MPKSNTIEGRVSLLEEHEREQYAVDMAQTEQIKTLFSSVKTLRNVMYTFALLMLLALIYGALGPTGFNAVTNRRHQTAPQRDTISSLMPGVADFDRWRKAA